MHKRLFKFFATAALSIIALLAASQNFPDQFKSFRLANDTTAQVALLKKWEAASPQDAELFVAYFNFYVQKSRREIVSIDKQQKDGQSFVVKDTATGKPLAFLGSGISYDISILQNGFDYIDKGIILYPNRLDMRFGKIYMLGELKNYRAFTDQIKIVIEYNASNAGNWTWTGNKPLENPKEFFLNAMQEYIIQLYNAGDDQLPLMREVAEAVLKYYPDHVECLSDAALTYLIIGEYDKALEYLLKAEAISPKDVVVLNNIAEAYSRKKDKTNAKVYYKKIIKFGNSDEAADAKQKLKSID